MPVALVGGAAALGGAALVSSANKNAAKTAAGAATDAANQNAQLAREQRDMMRGYVDPLVPYAGAGAAALAARAGISAANPAGNTFAAPAPTRVANIFAPAVPAASYGAGGSAPPPDGWSGTTPDERRASGGADGGGFSATGGINYGSGAPQAGAPDAPAAAGPQVDVQAFLASNPDVIKYYQSTPEAQRETLEGFAGRVAVEQADVRGPPPMLTGSPAGGGDNDGLENYMGASPAYAPRPTTVRPEQPEWQGSGAAPSAESYFDPSKFTASPDYLFRLNEGMRNLNAKFGARGLIKSGAALKGVTDYGQGMASAEYGNWWGRQNQLYTEALGQYNADKQNDFNIFSANRDNTNRNYDLDATRADTQYDSDRGYSQNLFDTNRNYATNRYDQQTGNIFSLAGIGTGAINTLGGVGSNYVNTVAGSNTAAADAKANSAIAGANSTANLFGNVAQAVGTAYGGSNNRTFSNPFAPASPAPASTLGSVSYAMPSYGSIFRGPF